MRVNEPAKLADEVGALLSNADQAQRQSETARALVEAGRGALVKTLSLLKPVLNGDRANWPSEAADEQIT